MWFTILVITNSILNVFFAFVIGCVAYGVIKTNKKKKQVANAIKTNVKR